MKKLIVTVAVLFAILLIAAFVELIRIVFMENNTIFSVSTIIISTSNEEDAKFIDASLRSELALKNNIRFDKTGDTLIVDFFSRNNVDSTDEKEGEVYITIKSKDRKATGIALDYIRHKSEYYEVLSKLIRSAAINFKFQ